MESGGLVPDELVDAIVAERLDREEIAAADLSWTAIRARFLRRSSFESMFEKDGTKILTIGVEVGDRRSDRSSFVPMDVPELRQDVQCRTGSQQRQEASAMNAARLWSSERMTRRK